MFKGIKILIGTMLLLPILFPLILVIALFEVNPQKRTVRNKLISSFIDKFISFYEKLSKFYNRYIYA